MTDYRVSLLQSSTNLLFSTVLIETEDSSGVGGLGTGFFFEEFNSPGRPGFLVTNRHVVEGAARVSILFHAGPVQDRLNFHPLSEYHFELPDPEKHWQFHPDPTIDLCALPVSRLKALAVGHLDQLLYSAIRDIEIPGMGEETNYPAAVVVTMVGYPDGLSDSVNNLPVLRRGITASHPAIDFKGRPDFVVDIACFAGSSGSPVLMTDDSVNNSRKFLGVLHSGPVCEAEGEIVVRAIPTRRSPIVVTRQMIHLGYAVKAREVATL